MTLDLPSVTFEDRSQLPGDPAVYFIVDLNEIIVYIGQADNLRMRWVSHHRAPQMCAGYRIFWQSAPKTDLVAIEERAIAEYRPVWNGSSVQGEKRHATIRPSKEMRERLEALSRIYGSNTAVYEAAVERLWRLHFQPESADDVLERAVRQLRLALAGLEGEIERRAELADRRDND